MEDSLGHLLNCAEKLFTEPVNEKSTSPPSSSKKKRSTERRQKRKHKEALSSASGPTEGGEANTDRPAAKVMQNVAKMATSILKIIADAAAVGLITHNHVKCLNFGSAFARYIVSFTGGQQNESSAFEEEDLKDVLVFLKSSFSYTSKLLHLVLKSSSESSAPPREVFYLANDLLDLIVSIESSLGAKYASHILSVAKPWLPILVLALGSQQLIKAREYQGTSSSDDLSVLPVWLVVLGKSELYEFKNRSNEEGKEQGEEESDDVSKHNAPIFKKLTEQVIVLLKKGNPRVLDAVSDVLSRGVLLMMERADFGLVLGLLNFTCMKLLGKEYSSWKELKLVSRSLQEIYLRIGRELDDVNLNEDGRIALGSAREIIESVPMDPE